ncbi:ribosome assembly cofactor RimP [Cruoricaptor ignavus]|uniref:Ribosome maturation factor RimP n=1 Tax=Cruoricaptor ignavus TaxID=1118202 RepID=A0A7M1T0L7_9FLAO|nr:ribosome assembly cofactor RimP [Cruoricaptor ignavus]QOR73386.1 ribosome assembly cofactor RimP [Cruoricaptor ignavus]
MEFRQKVEQLLTDFLQSRPDLFLMDLKISAGNDITVMLDGDGGVSLQDCLDASRAIENNLDREVQDFSLQVMSYGAAEPLLKPRQFVKNIGRTLNLQLEDDTEIEGEATRADEDSVALMLRYRKPKDVGKGKVDVEEEREIPYSQIKKAAVVIKF